MYESSASVINSIVIKYILNYRYFVTKINVQPTNFISEIKLFLSSIKV